MPKAIPGTIFCAILDMFRARLAGNAVTGTYHIARHGSIQVPKSNGHGQSDAAFVAAFNVG